MKTVNLKDIALSAFASDQLATETWSDLVVYCVGRVKEGVGLPALIAELAVCEKEMKAQYDVPNMPAAWRSAKSVVLAALAEELGLMDGEIVRGKTQVEKDIREARARKAGTVSDEEALLAKVQWVREQLRSMIGHVALSNGVIQHALKEVNDIVLTLRS